MGTTAKALREKVRAKYLTEIVKLFEGADEEILVTGANEIAMPCVDDEGNERFVVVTVKVPIGSRDGDPYDGYSMAEEYQIKVNSKKKKTE